MRFWTVDGAAGSPSLPTAAYRIPTTSPSRPRTSVEWVSNPHSIPGGRDAIPLVAREIALPTINCMDSLLVRRARYRPLAT
jgi:hypothetical protein